MAGITEVSLVGPSPESGRFIIGDTITVRTTFDEPVDLVGTVQLSLNTVPDVVYAASSPVTGASQIDWSYTVQEDDSTAGIFLEAVEIVPQSGAYICTTGSPLELADLDLSELSIGEAVSIDGIDLSFYFLECIPGYGGTGDSVQVVIGSTRCCSTPPTAAIGGGAPSVVVSSSDETGRIHTFDYTVRSDDIEGTSLSFLIYGSDSAGYSVSAQPVEVVMMIDRTAPSVPDTPSVITSSGVSGVSNDGSILWAWPKSTDALSGVLGYDYEIYENGASFDSGEIRYLSSDDQPDDVYVGVSQTTNGCLYKLRARSVDWAGVESEYGSWSDEVLVDLDRPTCTVSVDVTGTTNQDSFVAGILFSDEVLDLDIDSIDVVNASKGELTQLSATSFELVLVPTDTGAVEVSVLGDAAHSVGNNMPNLGSNTVIVQSDTVRPTCALSGASGRVGAAPIVFTAAFSKPVSGISTSSISVTGASVTGFTGQGAVYSFHLEPDSVTRPTLVRAQVNDEAGTDSSGNLSRASNARSVYFNDTTLEIVSIAPEPGISQGTYFRRYDRIYIVVTFSPDDPAIVKYTGEKPYLELVMDTVTRKAYYYSGSGTSKLVFYYTVQNEDPHEALVGNGNIICPPGSSIVDLYSKSVELTPSGGDLLSSSEIYVHPDHPTSASSGQSIKDSISTLLTQSTGSSLTKNTLKSGIGDGEDLSVRIVNAPNESWVPYVHKGWFYYQDQEYYLFSRKATKTIAPYTIGALADIIPSAEGYDVTRYVLDEPASVISENAARICRGSVEDVLSVRVNSSTVTGFTWRKNPPIVSFPNLTLDPTDTVLVSYTHSSLLQDGPVVEGGTSGATTRNYVQVSSPVVVANELSSAQQVPDTSLYSYEVDGLPIEVYRNDLNYPMRRVPAQECITDVSEYCVLAELVGSDLRHTVVVSGPTATYVTYVPKPETLSDPLEQQEICVVDKNLQIRSMYKDPVDSTVRVILVQDQVRTVFDASSLVSGNTVALPAAYTRSDAVTGSIKPGDRVGLVYKNNYSWTLDGSGIRAYAERASGLIDTLVVEYESSREKHWESDEVPESSGSFVQLNPLKARISSGFLYLVDTSTINVQPDKLILQINPSNVLVHDTKRKGQPSRILARVVDKDGSPIQGKQISVTTIGYNTVTRATTGNVDLVPSMPQTINGTAVDIYTVGVVDASGTLQYYPESAWTASLAASGLSITWSGTNQPSPGTSYRVYYRPGLGTIEAYGKHPSTGITDASGEYSFLWNPAFRGRTIFTVSIAGTSPLIYKSASVIQTSMQDQIAAALSETTLRQKALLVLTDESEEPGTLKVMAYISDITGAFPIKGATVTWTASKGKFSKPTSATNKDGIAVNNYYPAEDDQIYCSSSSIYSNFVRIGSSQ